MIVTNQTARPQIGFFQTRLWEPERGRNLRPSDSCSVAVYNAANVRPSLVTCGYADV